jgi:hypothetical protein
LGFVEAMDFVHEEDGALAELAAAFLGRGNRRADIGHPGQHRVDRDKMRPRGIGDDARQCGLAGAGGAVEDDRGELIGLDGAAQQPPRPYDVLLTDELVQRARPHPRGQGRLLLGQLLATGLKQIGGLVHSLIVAHMARKLEGGDAPARSESVKA